MAKKEIKKEASILEIIREMVSEGQSEEKIVSTLKDLGVEPDKAKRLLLLGQADTFALLRSEIGKIVASNIEKEKPAMQKFLQQESEKAGEAARKKVAEQAMQDIKKYEKAITGQSRTFQEQMHDNMRRVAEISDRVKRELTGIGARMVKVEQDLDEMKVRGIGLKSRILTAMLVVFGVVFCGAALYLFVTRFEAFITIDSMIMTVVMALVGITMIFVATLT